LLYLIPDAWDNVENAKLVRVPLLLVYSDADTVNPPDDGPRKSSNPRRNQSSWRFCMAFRTTHSTALQPRIGGRRCLRFLHFPMKADLELGSLTSAF
jgi:hypothetical protein